MLIEPSRWTEYFAELSRQAEGYNIAVEVLSGELGDQVEVRRAPLIELAFDPREGFAVAVGDPTGRAEVLRHAVARPSRIETTEESGVPSALMIEDDAGIRTLVRLAAPGADAA
jgi:hypothetical protein